MRPILLQFAFLVGTLSAVSQITSNVEPLEAVTRGGAAALAVLLVMMVGDLCISWVVRQSDRHVETSTSDQVEDGVVTGSMRRGRRALAA